jgi:hypothetical protein
MTQAQMQRPHPNDNLKMWVPQYVPNPVLMLELLHARNGRMFGMKIDAKKRPGKQKKTRIAVHQRPNALHGAGHNTVLPSVPEAFRIDIHADKWTQSRRSVHATTTSYRSAVTKNDNKKPC